MKSFTNLSSFDKRGPDAHFVSFLFYYCCIHIGMGAILKENIYEAEFSRNSYETVVLFQKWFKNKELYVSRD